MTILKKVSFILLFATATAINCKNPLFDKLKDHYPTVAKPETLFGTTLTFAGLIPAHIGSKKYTVPRRLFLRFPGVSLMAVGVGCIGHSFNEKYKWIK